MKHRNMDYDNRYKYKLDMLEPGITMMKLIGVLFVTGIYFGWQGGIGFLQLLCFWQEPYLLFC